MAVIAAALGVAGLLARVAPDIVGAFTGDDSKATKITKTAANVAKTLTGQADEEAAVAALENNPALLIEFEREVRRAALREMELENERLKTVNETMRVESQSQHAYVRNWRPTFGYVVSGAWAILFLAIAYAMVATPQYAAELIQAATSLTPLWGIALAVLGVNVMKRSEDKKVAAGMPPQAGLFQKLLNGAAG